MTSSQIHSVQTVSGNQARVRRIIEEASQTIANGPPGIPVQIAVDGGVKIWDGITVAFGIAGFSLEGFSNLTTLGVAKTLTFGSVPYEASAVNIPRGAPLNDGRIGFETASQDTVFKGQVGPAQTAVVGDVGVQYGMTQDTDKSWYVDKTKTTVGTNTVVTIVKLDPQDESATPRGVYFVVTTAAAQIVA
jgi:hypothetical protein